MDSSIISDTVLSSLSQSSSLDLGTFNALVVIVSKMLCREEKYLDSEVRVKKLVEEGGDEALLTSLHSSLTCLLTLLSSQNSPPDVLTQLLEDLPLPPSHITSLVSTYTSSLPLIRSGLTNTTTFANRRLINFAWRLDYRVRSSGASMNEPVFLCNFRTVDNEGVEREEEIECGIAGVKDMLFKVGQAGEVLK
ncbi:hypothetical protein TrST_g3062 [Triparma strigata]|uniref:COMM domain-containing protein n=1 Tax=Triparma strigata TaxID=1606541 RepID=A0A9W7ANZ1_9STRA|nr:hypothetical protein TrST_g3062 [Triparma strigata]